MTSTSDRLIRFRSSPIVSLTRLRNMASSSVSALLIAVARASRRTMPPRSRAMSPPSSPLAGEYFSRESKFEIVLLEWGAECMELSPSLPQVHCGRHPHFTCHSRATSIGRLAKCTSFNGKLMGNRVRGSMQTYSRFGNSPCSSSPCYSVQDRWFCPAMAAGS